MFPKSNFSSQDRPQKKKRLYAINKKMNELRRSPSGTTLLDFDGAAIDRKSSNLSSSTNSAQLSQTSPRAGLVRESAQQNHEQNGTARGGRQQEQEQQQQQQQQQTTQAAPSISLPRQRDAVKHFALDLGGSLIKLVYFSANRPNSAEDADADGHGQKKETTKALGGRLHFRRFPSSSLRECLSLIHI